MTIEARLDRLIELNEQILAIFQNPTAAATTAPAGAPASAPATGKSKGKGKGAEATASQPAPTPATGAATTGSAPAASAASDDDFLNDAPAAPKEEVKIDKNAVRAALVEYQSLSSAEEARKLMAVHGNGADALGKIPEDKYAAVHNAAKKAVEGIKALS